MMQFILKVAISVAIIIAATAVARKFPTAGGLIAVMPLAGLLVMTWVYLECKGDPFIMQGFTKGALWGILPSVLFYLVALYGFRRGLSLPVVLVYSFGAWVVAAVVHQWALR